MGKEPLTGDQNTHTRTRIKRAEGHALQGVRSRDLAGTDLKGTHTQDLKGTRIRILVGTHRARAADTVGAHTQIQAHACDKGTSVAIVRSKIPMLVPYERYLCTVACANKPDQWQPLKC